MEFKDNESTIVSDTSVQRIVVFPYILRQRTVLVIIFFSLKLFCSSSCQSNMTVQTDGEGGGFVTDSTIADTTSVVSVQSSVSTRSSRSGLTRQGNRKSQTGGRHSAKSDAPT